MPNPGSPENAMEWIQHAGFHDFAVYTIGQPQIIQQFKEATGNDLTALVKASPLESMINTATLKCLASFLNGLKSTIGKQASNDSSIPLLRC